MEDTELIDGIKTRLSITGSYHDELLLGYSDDVIAFMLSAGVSQTIIDDATKSLGVIARGVADLWNYGSGQGKFSEMFFQRVTQLAYMGDGAGEGNVIVPISKDDIDKCTDCLED